MTEPNETSEEAKRRKRLITLGEVIALAGLTISALALWNSWKSDKDDKPTVAVESHQAIPLALRGKVEDDGKALRLTPAEASHALDSVRVSALPPGKGSADFGGDPLLSAATIESWLPKEENREGAGGLNVSVETHYIEAGESRTAKQRYRVTYRWTDGGLFGGKSPRLTSISRI